MSEPRKARTPLPGYPMRRTGIATRCALLLLALWNLLVLISGLMNGQLYVLSLTAAVLAAAAFLALRWSSARLRAITAVRNRPSPDYAIIARIEREVYGETFRHDGAPATGGFAVPPGAVCTPCETWRRDPAVAALDAQMDALVAESGKRAMPARSSFCRERHPWDGELDGFGRATCGPCATRRQLVRKHAMCDKGVHVYEVSEPDCVICREASWR